ncbi:hypothetical protein BGZ79_003401, partial [Entomortierella chlamydospora]
DSKTALVPVTWPRFLNPTGGLLMVIDMPLYQWPRYMRTISLESNLICICYSVDLVCPMLSADFAGSSLPPQRNNISEQTTTPEHQEDSPTFKGVEVPKIYLSSSQVKKDSSDKRQQEVLGNKIQSSGKTSQECSKTFVFDESSINLWYMNEEDARRVYESGEQFTLDGRKLGIQYAQGRRKSPNQMRSSGRDPLVATLVLDLAQGIVATDDGIVAVLCVVVTLVRVLALVQDPPAAVRHLLVVAALAAATDLIHPDVAHTPRVDDHHRLETVALL